MFRPHITGMIKTICAVAVAWVFVALAAPVFAASHPFVPGEKLHYDIYWAFVRAGSATLEVMPQAEVDGTPAYHFQAQARSTPFVDNFYELRDRMDSFVDLNMDRALHYEKVQREGGYKRDIVLDFDWNVARLTRYSRGRFKNNLFFWPARVFDPLSMLYKFRTSPMSVGSVFEAPVTDGKNKVLGKATVVRRETIKTSLGKFDTFLVEPETKHVGGMFKKSPKAKLQVWITADERMIPVKVKSKVAVGHFSLELTGIERVEPGTGVDLVGKDEIKPLPRD